MIEALSKQTKLDPDILGNIYSPIYRCYPMRISLRVAQGIATCLLALLANSYVSLAAVPDIVVTDMRANSCATGEVIVDYQARYFESQEFVHVYVEQRISGTWYQTANHTIWNPDGGLPPTYQHTRTGSYFLMPPGSLYSGTYRLKLQSTSILVYSPVFEVKPPLTGFDVSVTNPTSACPANGSITVSNIVGGNQPHIVKIEGLQTSVRSGLSPGQYTIVVTDNVGCTHTEVVTLSGPSSLKVELAASRFCRSRAPFSNCNAYAFVTGGTPPYSYSWKESGIPISGTSSSIMYASCTGTYTVRVIDNSSPRCTVDVTNTMEQQKVVDGYTVYPSTLRDGMRNFDYSMGPNLLPGSGCLKEVTVTVPTGTVPFGSGVSPWIIAWFTPEEAEIGLEGGTPFSYANPIQLGAGTYFLRVTDDNGNGCPGWRKVVVDCGGTLPPPHPDIWSRGDSTTSNVDLGVVSQAPETVRIRIRDSNNVELLDYTYSQPAGQINYPLNMGLQAMGQYMIEVAVGSWTPILIPITRY